MRINLLAISVFLFCITASARNMDISGSVLEESTGQPLPYAHVYLLHKARGTSTNLEGRFHFHFEYEDADTLCISYIGFSNYYIPVKSINAGASLTIRLKESAIHKNEVTVADYTPRSLMHEVLKNYSRNYFCIPVSQTAELKEYSKKNGRYLRLVDAGIDLYSYSYRADDMEQCRAKVLSGRVSLEDHMPATERGLQLFLAELSPERLLTYLYYNVDPSKLKLRIESMSEVEDHDAYKLTAETDQLVSDQASSSSFIYYIDKASKAVIAYEFIQDRNEYPHYVYKDDSALKMEHSYVIGFVNYRPFQNKWIISGAQLKADTRYTYRDSCCEQRATQIQNWLVYLPSEMKYERVKRPFLSKCLDLTQDIYPQIAQKDDKVWDDLDKVVESTAELEVLDKKEFNRHH